jgi:iron complex outermembrane receptor protein
VNAEYAAKRFNANLRFNYFGEISLINYSGNLYTYTPKYTIDASVGYDITGNLHLTVGAANLTNQYPDPTDPFETETGGAWDAVQMGFNGMFLFSKLGFTF